MLNLIQQYIKLNIPVYCFANNKFHIQMCLNFNDISNRLGDFVFPGGSRESNCYLIGYIFGKDCVTFR